MNIGGQREDGWTSEELVGEAGRFSASGRYDEYGEGGWRARSREREHGWGGSEPGWGVGRGAARDEEEQYGREAADRAAADSSHGHVNRR